MGWGRLAYDRVLKDDIVRAQREAGSAGFWALPYAHKAGVAGPLNEWMAAEVAPIEGAVAAATFHPNDTDLTALAARAFDGLGLRIAKLHCSVGRFDADDVRLEPMWALAEARGIVVVVHAGHDPTGGPARASSRRSIASRRRIRACASWSRIRGSPRWTRHSTCSIAIPRSSRT